MYDFESLQEFIKVARGETPADKVFRNGKIINTLSQEVYPGDLAVHKGIIVGVGSYAGKETVDCQGKYLSPGWMDAHVHLESSMVSPIEFARAVLPLGTTSVFADPHEIANVRGLDGIRYILEANQAVPLDIHVNLPSCVPATGMETSGANLTHVELGELYRADHVVGLAELMNFPGVLFCDPGVLRKILLFQNKIIDGHAPLISGKDLCAYILAGPASDHECTNVDEAREKLRLGMHIFVREGSVTRDLQSLLPLITDRNFHRFCFATDDREPIDLMAEGHINFLLRKAVNLGLDPVIAITMASFNPASYFGIRHKGALAPGYAADLVILKDLTDFKPEQVYKNGILVAREGQALFNPGSLDDAKVRHTVNLHEKLNLAHLSITSEPGLMKTIEIVPNQILTHQIFKAPKVVEGQCYSDPEHDIIKVAVIERHNASGNLGLGFVRGFGLKQGALASTVAHDSHNIIVLGVTDEDMFAAVQEIVAMEGGQVAVKNGEVLARLPLPIGGLMSDQPLPEVKAKLEELFSAAKQLGVETHSPFMTMAFIALPVIPELKITDKGLVDVNKFKLVPLFEE